MSIFLLVITRSKIPKSLLGAGNSSIIDVKKYLEILEAFKKEYPHNPFVPLHDKNRVIWVANDKCKGEDVRQVLEFIRENDIFKSMTKRQFYLFIL